MALVSETPIPGEVLGLRAVAASGSVETVDAAYRRLRSELVTLATLLAGSQSAGEEVVHDVFAAAIPRWGRIEQPERYLRRAVANRVRSRGRRRAAARRWAPDPTPVIGEPELDATWDVVRRLPFNQRAALVLRIYVDLPDHEIAEHLGCSESTVRSHVRRGLNRLREELK